MLRAARALPEALVIGIDADAASMVESSRRAARRSGGLPNALFVAAAAEALPPELDGLVDDVRIQFPWGSLLEGLVRAEPAVLRSLARVCRPGGSLRAIWSLTKHERGTGLLDVDLAWLPSAFRPYGFEAEAPRPATPDEIVDTGSSWAKRLGVGRARPAIALRARRR